MTPIIQNSSETFVSVEGLKSHNPKTEHSKLLKTAEKAECCSNNSWDTSRKIYAGVSVTLGLITCTNIAVAVYSDNLFVKNITVLAAFFLGMCSVATTVNTCIGNTSCSGSSGSRNSHHDGYGGSGF